ncbi:putative pleckstrin homology domain-containing protein 1 [Iris pallida]|uniref:Pleckstrin homology domain-containing protein 1 n=1 Tax=Iris pallida TaxID=29817 RepID=A0AAX6EYB9_IRIPA|nr:putative pleckstrin homology domain-containing protein 1 [Iris pallida]
MASLLRGAFGYGSVDPSATGGVEFWSSPERAGWLNKQGEYIKTWRRRWFVLKQGKLFWFKDPAVTRASVPAASSPPPPASSKGPRTRSTASSRSRSPPRPTPCTSSPTPRRRRRSGSTRSGGP